MATNISGMTEEDAYTVRKHASNYVAMLNEQEMRQEIINSFIEIARLKKIIENLDAELEKCNNSNS